MGVREGLNRRNGGRRKWRGGRTRYSQGGEKKEGQFKRRKVKEGQHRKEGKRKEWQG